MKILITGAATGIGYDATVALASNGHQIIAAVENDEQKAVLVPKLLNYKKSIQVIRLNILSEADLSAASKIKVDVLINNAGIGEAGPLATVPIAKVKQNFEVNVLGTLRLTQAILPNMIKNNSGRILIVSSVAGLIAAPYLAPYSITKFSLEAIGDSLRLELKPYNIKVVLIEPGTIATGFNERLLTSKNSWWKTSKLFFADDVRMKKIEMDFFSNQAKTDSVVRAIVSAVESPNPKTRYIRPWKSRVMVKLSRAIPDKLRDWYINQGLK